MNKLLIKKTGLIILSLMILVFGCEKSPTSIQESDFNRSTLDVNNTRADEPLCIDADGNIYKVIKIGNQWWMAENLRTMHFQNGDPIAEVTSANEWKRLTSAAFCFYDNDSSIETEYGLLYNWRAITDRRHIAPEGWHVPSDAEYQILDNFLGGRGKAGGKMKEQGTEHWAYPNNASNSSGFTALPGGFRDNRGTFWGLNGFGFLWTKTSSPVSGAWNRYMDHMYVELDRGSFHKRCGFSVRCVLKIETNNITVVE